MQAIRVADGSGRFALILAIGFAAAALSLAPRTAAPSFTLPLPDPVPQASALPATVPMDVVPAQTESKESAPRSGWEPALIQQQTAPNTSNSVRAKPVTPAAAPSAQTPTQDERRAPATSGGSRIVTIWPENGGPLTDPLGRFK